uniref:Neurotransmitter-gated ion-channel ligand-binding domain-containing protein n=1 Tax=Plectus sambesii TaxID=2011161 RepID=A0A914UU14_9BILA
MQWLKLTWKDPNLQWNPKQYENIHFTYFPAENIWRPDIAIYNQRDEIKLPFPLGGVVAEVFFDGTVLIELLQSVEITCQEFDVADFPFDTQICTTRYASWMRGNEQLILTTDFELNNEEQFNPHSEWDLLAFVPSYDQMNVTYTTLLNMEETDGSEKLINRSAVFDEVHYDLKIRRKPNYYIYSLIIPSGIITTLCIIGLFAPFEASGNREEKVCTCILVGMHMFGM